jgi:uncharacterized protein
MVSSKRTLLLVLLTLCFAIMTSAPSTASDLTDALELRDVAKVRSLIAAGTNVNEVVRRDSPLNIAATYGPVEMVTILLEAGAVLERPGRDGLHPLHNAVILGHRDIVALLIQKGAVVDAKENKGRTPLISFVATGGSDIEIARMLLAAGADPGIESASDDDNYTALDYTAETGSVELAGLLIAHGADINHRQGYRGDPALLGAVYHGHLELVRLLIAHGADVNLVNNLGQRPLFFAAKKPEIQRLLVAAGAK